jgi:tetrahydromethanopterin S-methyltransferase subunit A
MREEAVDVLQPVREQVAKATAARKCHPCGCFQQTAAALAGTAVGRSALGSELAKARNVFVEKEYDCLGCRVCYPAIAANAFAQAFPDVGEELELCPAAEPEARRGWPPLPGDYHVVRYQAPVAVCTLHSEDLAAHLAEDPPEGLSIAGTMQTENLGIERVIRNVLANPHVRFLILCGEDTKQTIGHLPGQSFQSLFEHGIDTRRRIRGARSKRPLLKNVTTGLIRAFLEQVELVSAIGEHRAGRIQEAIERCAARDPGRVARAPAEEGAKTVEAEEPRRTVADPAGFFIVYPETRLQRVVVEHYTRQGVLGCVIEGRTPSAIAATAIERGLLTRLDHAAYLGQELGRAQHSMRTGERYVQERAPGEARTDEDEPARACPQRC